MKKVFFLLALLCSSFLLSSESKAQPFDYCKFETKEGAQCPASGYAGNQNPFDAKNCSGTAGADQVCCCTKKPDDVKDATPPGPKKVIPPVLSVSIPGFGKFSDVRCENPDEPCQIPWLAEYIGALYKYSLVIIGLLAVIVMMIGGVRWLTAGGSREAISDAMNWIKGGLLGIILAICSYLLLFTINPNLTMLQPLNISYVGKLELDRLDSPDAGNTNTELSNGQPDGKCLATGSINDMSSIVKKYVGKVTYRYGGNGGDGIPLGSRPTKCPAGQLCYDCSNFMRHIFSCVGKVGPSGTTGDIFSGAEKINSATGTSVNGITLKPGDLVGWPKIGSANNGHVIMYIGNGELAESHGGSGWNGNSVSISSFEAYYSKFKAKGKDLRVRRIQ